MAEPLIAPRTYVQVFAGLIVLTGLTVLLAYIDLGLLHAPVGLTIAAAKGVLILLFFMHWLHSYPMIRVIALSGLVWLSILIGMSLSDFLTRHLPLGTTEQALEQPAGR